MSKIISSAICKTLAQKIAENTPLKYVENNKRIFPDGELRIHLLGEVAYEEIFILQSVSSPIHDNLMELLLLVDAAKRAKATKITVLLSYLAYGRQDKVYDHNGPLAAALIAKLITASGADCAIILDFHNCNMSKFFNIESYNLSSSSLFKQYLTIENNTVLVAPDYGGEKRAQDFKSEFGIKEDIAIIEKIRLQDKCIMKNMTGDVSGKNCIIFDDIIDSGNTIYLASEFLKKHGAKNIIVCATHAIFSSNALEKITASPIDKVFVTNSINKELLHKKITVIDISPLFIKFLNKKLNN